MPVKSVAFFVTPHGFGHAARAAAIMDAIAESADSIRFEIFAETPRWFFEQSVRAPFGYHKVLTDIGFVQTSPFQEDLAGTLEKLASFFPPSPILIDDLAKRIKRLKCRAVVCDIAPLGIAVAKKAGVASVLVENFTWDWIYGAYTLLDKRIGRYAAYLKELFSAADRHIQTEPVCNPVPDADLTVGPVGRKPRTSPDEIRKKLKVGDGCKLVTVTTGGVETEYGFVEKLEKVQGVVFVVAGIRPLRKYADHVVFLPQRSPFYHPDLIDASDAVIGKAGYSTLAETYLRGVPFGYVSRKMFPEAEVLARFAEREMDGFEIEEARFHEGAWIDGLPELLSGKRRTPRDNGADPIARHIRRWAGL